MRCATTLTTLYPSNLVGAVVRGIVYGVALSFALVPLMQGALFHFHTARLQERAKVDGRNDEEIIRALWCAEQALEGISCVDMGFELVRPFHPFELGGF